MGNVAGNPIDEPKQQKIKEITERVCGAFSKYYMMSFKEVMITHTKQKIADEEQSGLKEAKRQMKDAKPVRPRTSREAKPKLSARIIYTMTLDSDLDPYIVYAISASDGNRYVTVYKRYKQFKNLKAKLKVKDVEFPKPSSKFGGRNLDAEFISTRVTALQKYLDAAVADEKASQSKELLTFLGLGEQPDPLWTETFEGAYKKTRYHLWQWRTVIYDSEEEAVSRICVEEIKDSMFEDIRTKLPPQPLMRKKTMQAVYKSINASVAPPVQAAYQAVRKAADGVKPTIEKVISESLKLYFDKETELKEKIGQILQSAMEPVLAQIKEIIGGFSGQIFKMVMSPINALLPENVISEKASSLMGIFNGDEADKCKEIGGDFKGVRKSIDDKMTEELGTALDPIIGPFKDKVTLDALKGVFAPFAKFDRLIHYLLEFFDPDNQLHVAAELLKWKKKIKEAPIDKVNSVLDDEEWDISYWAIWRSDRDLRWSGWGLAWQLYSVLPYECYSVVSVFYDFVYAVAKINKDALKKFSWRFGDYLWDAAKAASPENWAKTVDDCFLIGWQKFTKHVRKHLLLVVASYIKQAARVLMISKIEKMIMEGAEQALKPLADLIVSPLDQLIDLYAFVSDVITNTLDNVLDDVLGSVHPNLDWAFKYIKNPATDEVRAKAAEIKSSMKSETNAN